jgi:tetratricopeptide (TPR) repeat protein
MLGAQAIVFGAGSVALIYLWKRPRVDNVLLALYLVFAFLAACVIGFGVDALLPERDAMLEAKVHQFHGQTAEALGRWDEAATFYSLAAETLPGEARLLERAGVASFKSGGYDEAVTLLGSALATDPISPVSTEYEAIAEMNLGRTDAAINRMTQAVEAGIRPALFLTHLGELFLGKGDAGTARTFLRRALCLGQPDLPARLRYADALAASGGSQDALKQYEDVASGNPKSAEARDALGRFYHSTGKTDLALTELRAAVGLKPDEPLYWNNLAVAYRDLRMYEEAMDALDYALGLDPRLVDAYYNRGEVYRAMGSPSDARRQYLMALEIDSGFEPARAALENDNGTE